jgi:hypothetical protein
VSALATFLSCAKHMPEVNNRFPLSSVEYSSTEGEQSWTIGWSIVAGIICGIIHIVREPKQTEAERLKEEWENS